MASVSTAMHTAVFSRLTSELSSAAVFAGRLTSEQTWPAVYVGDVVEVERDGVGALRTRRVVQLTVYSDFPGPAEVLDILGEVKAAFHRRDLPLSEGHAIVVRVTSTSSQLDADGMTYMGDATLEVITSP